MRWSRPSASKRKRGPIDWCTTAIAGCGQYLSIRYTQRLAEAGIEPSLAS